MCVVSMIGDHYTKKWRRKYPSVDPGLGFPWPLAPPPPQITRDEFEALKRDFAEMKELLMRAKEYDARTNQPECETEEKVAILRRVAELVGVSLDDVLGSEGTMANNS